VVVSGTYKIENKNTLEIKKQNVILIFILEKEKTFQL
jgi:hypothetical protein